MLTVCTDLIFVIVETLFQDDLNGGRRSACYGVYPKPAYFGRLLHFRGNVCEIVDVFFGLVRG